MKNWIPIFFWIVSWHLTQTVDWNCSRQINPWTAVNESEVGDGSCLSTFETDRYQTFENQQDADDFVAAAPSAVNDAYNSQISNVSESEDTDYSDANSVATEAVQESIKNGISLGLKSGGLK